MDYSRSLSLENIVFFSEYDKVWRTEEFKDIPGYEGYYQVSDLGRVKGLSRRVKHYTGVDRLLKEKFLKQSTEKAGYYFVSLAMDGKNKIYKTHQLVSMAFLNHTPCGYKLVVNHKDFDKKNNYVYNLELVTQRENANKKHVKSSSQYIGVSWDKEKRKWAAKISIKENNKHKSRNIGRYKSEYEAHLAYQKALKEVTNGS